MIRMTIVLLILLTIYIFSIPNVYGGTIINNDRTMYKLEYVFKNGSTGTMILLPNATRGGACPTGCYLKNLTTNDIIYLGVRDIIQIQNGKFNLTN
jgi:hypothetical protein